jgi:hypothetical protein
MNLLRKFIILREKKVSIFQNPVTFFRIERLKL